MSANTSESSKRHNSVENPLIRKQPTNLGDTNYLTPTKSESESKPNSEIATMDATPSIDFLTLTAADFGITPESFTKQNKGQSQNMLNKLRRRSTIGIRGSPENNSLIRFIAHQRRAKKQDSIVQVSPFKHQNTLLKDKIAAFQSSFKPLEENEERQIHTAEISKEINAKPHEQSELGQVLSSVCGRIASEENATQNSIRKTSPDIQGHSNVSPSLKSFLAGTADTMKAIPDLLESNTKSEFIILETTPSKGIPRTAHDNQSSPTSEELIQNVSSQQSCKKVRFAEKQRLEIFDKTKPPITPVQRGHLSSRSVRSVLKKTIRVVTGDKECGIENHIERVDDTKKEEFPACLGSILNGKSTRSIDDVMVKKEVLSSDEHNRLLPMDIPLHKQRRILLTSSSSIGSLPDMTPDKPFFSQPGFDHDDDQESSEVASAPECDANCDLEETTKSSLHLKAASDKITRLSAKRKHVSKAEETNFGLKSKMQIKNSKPTPSEIPKAKPATKSQKKKPAAKHKVFGQRRRRKKQQIALYGQRETASKTPLLSPIPEVKEDIMFMSSFQNTPESHSSTFDDSISSILHGEFVNRKDENNEVLHSDKEDGDCLHPTLDLLNKLDSMSGSFSQHADNATNVLKNTLPLDSPKENCPEKLRAILHENEHVFKNDCTSGKVETLEELALPQFHGADKNINTKEISPIGVGSIAKLMNESDSMNFKKFPRRSRRLTFYLPNDSETSGNISSIPADDMEKLPHASDASEFLHSLECCREASLTSTSRRVRRSMRQHKDAQNEGLVWIQVPANNFIGQAPLDSACNIQRRMSSGPQESEQLHQKEVNSTQLPFIISKEQENAHAPPGPHKLQRRKSINVLRAKENDNVALHAQRNRRASLGYKSDHCYRKGSEIRKILKKQPTVED